MAETATLQIRPDSNDRIVIQLEGHLDTVSTSRIWPAVVGAVNGFTGDEVIVDCIGVSYCDGTGVGLLFNIRCQCSMKKITCEVHGLKAEFSKLLDSFNPSDYQARAPRIESSSVIRDAGRSAVGIATDIRNLVIYVGELTESIFHTVLRPKKIRWRDVFLVAEQVGADAVPIIGLIGFLLGLILTFQSAIPMRQFGADIFVADLVSISLVRELGPLMTAIILAGRTGAAFAAELGTMKINEELDALDTMGLKPVRFLVLTRVLGTVVMTPLLTLYGILFGLIGSLIVYMSLGFPMITFCHQVTGFVGWIDLAGGLFKSLFFGLLVAAIGCMRGLETQAGASAVGISTTRAVVSGIVLIAIADGVFAVMFFYLGL
jgi:phospholipid/cholesterol/gamma-HCH transport system permease protein